MVDFTSPANNDQLAVALQAVLRTLRLAVHRVSCSLCGRAGSGSVRITIFSGTVIQHEVGPLSQFQVEAGVRIQPLAKTWLPTTQIHRRQDTSSLLFPSKSEIAKGHMRAPLSIVRGQE